MIPQTLWLAGVKTRRSDGFAEGEGELTEAVKVAVREAESAAMVREDSNMHVGQMAFLKVEGELIEAF